MKRSLLLLALAACGDNTSTAHPDATPRPDAAPDSPPGPQTVTLKFTPVVGSEPFACGHTYANLGADATTITPRDFRVYVSEVELVAADGTHVPVTLDQDGEWQYLTVAMLDFEDFTGGCVDGTPDTNLSIRGTVPSGNTYTGVAFTVGIPEELNHVDLTTLPAPMNTTGLWWGWGFGHIFFAEVAHVDLTDPTPGVNDFFFHVGTVGCSGDPEAGEPVTCTSSNRPRVELSGFDPTSHAITVDYAVPLAASHLATDAGCHSDDAAVCTPGFASLGVDFATGESTAANQHVFRVDP